MAKQKATSLGAGLLRTAKKEQHEHSDSDGKPVAMTLKLPQADYVRLKTIAAQRKTNGQSLMLEAVREYLSRIAS
jgi:hypothetical protein